MTKQQIMDYFGKSVYQIWLEIAMRHFDHRDPELSFMIANSFLKELSAQESKF